MIEQHPFGSGAPIVPKDVFARSNMPSRWERIFNVAPKTSEDRKYLAFVAARFRGEDRLPHPHEVIPPVELRTRQRTQYAGWTSSALAIVLAWIGIAADSAWLVAAGIAVIFFAIAAMIVVSESTDPAIREYQVRRFLCEAAESRLQADLMEPINTSTLNEMITADEGTLAYCAAKIASEIEQDPAWKSLPLELISIDLWDEVAEVGESARQIAEDRKATARLENGRLRDDPEVRTMIDADRQLREEALRSLSARVSAFADYRDRLQREGMAVLRERNAPSRATRRFLDAQARERLR